MRYSKLFGKTIKEVPRDATLISHKLLHQGGFIRESTAGRYYYLPLGLRVSQKISLIIKNEMDKAGAQEIVTPVLHPKSLWEETNRTKSVGFELMSIKDRNNTEFVLGGTAEEMLVDLVRKFQLSYKDLPTNLYQFSTKFRDELRARGGLLRVREFIMKDAYSFHATEDDFKREYQLMRDTYTNIFSRLGLAPLVVASDNGYIGGEYCHEFIVVSDAGESPFLVTHDGSYAAHEDIAVFRREQKNIDEKEKEMKEVHASRGTTMEDGVTHHNKPLWQQIKDVVFVDEQGRFILAVIRGDYDINTVKLLHVIHAYQLRLATEEEIRTRLHSEPGFISPVGIKDIIEKDVTLLVVGDISLRTIKNAYGGGNKLHTDLMNINLDRDYRLDKEGDIALGKEGYHTTDGKELKKKKGIEVGNIFQLGFHYSSKMKDAEFIDASGQKKPYYMGCYGLGIGRTLATIVEVYHDDKGIIWPESVTPFQVHLIGLHGDMNSVRERSEHVYNLLHQSGVEVLYDDRRDVGAGEKFADADLIGIPLRVVVSSKTGDNVEIKYRKEKEVTIISLDKLLEML